jgi:zinc transport system substrate-binding protein
VFSQGGPWKAVAAQLHPLPSLILAVAVAVLSGCGGSASNPGSGNSAGERSLAAGTGPSQIRVCVTSRPLLEMALLVAGEQAIVEKIIPDEERSLFWKPGAAEIRRLQDADLILIHGAGFEPWLDRISVPESTIVDTGSVFEDQLIRVSDFVVHQHGPDGEHSQEGVVRETWLDPELATAQLNQVVLAFTKLQPEHADKFIRRAAPLTHSLEATDSQIEALAAQTSEENLTILSDGPYYHYLTRRLKWKLNPVSWPEASSELPAVDQEKLKERAEKSLNQLILIRMDHSDSASKLAESAGLTPVFIDLCERISDTDESLDVRLKRNIARLTEALNLKGSQQSR